MSLETIAHPDRGPGMAVLIDLHPVRELVVDPTDMKDLVWTHKQLAHSGMMRGDRTAQLIRNENDETLGKLYNALMQKGPLRVQMFYELREALQWLGLEEAEAQVRTLRKELRPQLSAKG